MVERHRGEGHGVSHPLLLVRAGQAGEATPHDQRAAQSASRDDRAHPHGPESGVGRRVAQLGRKAEKVGEVVGLAALQRERPWRQRIVDRELVPRQRPLTDERQAVRPLQRHDRGGLHRMHRHRVDDHLQRLLERCAARDRLERARHVVVHRLFGERRHVAVDPSHVQTVLRPHLGRPQLTVGTSVAQPDRTHRAADEPSTGRQDVGRVGELLGRHEVEHRPADHVVAGEAGHREHPGIGEPQDAIDVDHRDADRQQVQQDGCFHRGGHV